MTKLDEIIEAPATTSGIFYWKFISYIVIGILLICANTPVLANILRHKVLRAKKEYLLLAGLVFADMLAGWSTLIAGVYRMKLIASQEENNQVSRSHCLGTPPFLLLTFSITVQASMLVVVSVDRLIAVTLPLKYTTFTQTYAILMVTACYLLTSFYAALLVLHVYIVDSHTKSTMNAVCIVGEVDGLFSSVFYVRLCMATLSVLVYVVVWCLFRRYQRVTFANFPNAKSHLRRIRRAQRHLTSTVGICALFTLAFYVIPTSLMFSKLKPDLWAPLYWAISCFNAVINVFVYSLRHEDIRMGLKLLFIGEELPSQSTPRHHKVSTKSLNSPLQKHLIITRKV